MIGEDGNMRQLACILINVRVRLFAAGRDRLCLPWGNGIEK